VPVGVTGHRTQRPRGQVGPPGPHPAQPSSSLDPGGERGPITRPLAPLVAQLVAGPRPSELAGGTGRTRRRCTQHTAHYRKQRTAKAQHQHQLPNCLAFSGLRACVCVGAGIGFSVPACCVCVDLGLADRTSKRPIKSSS
jgi:hypothetical protein